MTEITIFDKIVAKEIPSKGIYEDELVSIKKYIQGLCLS